MEIDKLESVCMVNAYKNFAEAAFHRFISPATISKHILQVEEELGVPLFERATKAKPVMLTPQGESVIEDIQSIVNAYYRILKTVQSKQPLKTLTVGYIPRVGGFGEADIICDFVRRNPDVTLVRRVGWGTELATMLTTGTVDTVLISLLGENPFDTIPALAVLKTPEYHIVQVSESRVLRIGVSENHPLARSKKITKEMFPQLRDEVFLFGLLPDTCPYEHSRKHIERLLGLEGKMRCQFVDTTDRDVVLQLVRDGNGVLPQACFIPEVLNGVHFLPVEGWDVPARLYFVYPASKSSKLLSRFKQVVEQHISN
jgi:DNA-binding transcriptional LysR family regulator